MQVLSGALQLQGAMAVQVPHQQAARAHQGLVQLQQILQQRS
jgi:hypothetical protein